MLSQAIGDSNPQISIHHPEMGEAADRQMEYDRVYFEAHPHRNTFARRPFDVERVEWIARFGFCYGWVLVEQHFLTVGRGKKRKRIPYRIRFNIPVPPPGVEIADGEGGV